jgi:hypothetical protein
MPPWYADPAFGEFTNKPTLTRAQAETLAAWADGDAPQGDGAPPAPPAAPPEGWNRQMNRPPDQVIELPAEFNLPSRGEVPTFTLWLKVPFRDDRFVEAMQILPTNKAVVHHSSISIGRLPPRTRLGRAPAWIGGPVADGVLMTNDGRRYQTMANEEFGYPLLFYVPGGGFLRFPQGIAKRLSADQYLDCGFHFITTGRLETVRMRLGLWFARRTVTHEAILITVNERLFVDGRPLVPDAQGRVVKPNIPPFAENWTIAGTFTFANDVTLYSLWPHMHFRGKDMTFIVTYPNGREETLLSVPKYNPNWQITYELTRPKKIPARSSIRAVAHYDNSIKNPYNPAPSQEVLWGELAENEMFLPFLEISVDRNDLRFESLEQRLR